MTLIPIVCMSGEARSGKDSAADALRNHETDSRKWMRIGFADRLKEIAQDIVGGDFSGEMTEAQRRFLQLLGDAIRSYNQGYFVNYVMSKIQAVASGKSLQTRMGVVITDFRYYDEMSRVLQHMKDHPEMFLISLHVERAGRAGALKGDLAAHKTEQEMAKTGPKAEHLAHKDLIIGYRLLNNGTLHEHQETVRVRTVIGIQHTCEMRNLAKRLPDLTPEAEPPQDCPCCGQTLDYTRYRVEGMKRYDVWRYTCGGVYEKLLEDAEGRKTEWTSSEPCRKAS